MGQYEFCLECSHMSKVKCLSESSQAWTETITAAETDEPQSESHYTEQLPVSCHINFYLLETLGVDFKATVVYSMSLTAVQKLARRLHCRLTVKRLINMLDKVKVNGTIRLHNMHKQYATTLRYTNVWRLSCCPA